MMSGWKNYLCKYFDMNVWTKLIKFSTAELGREYSASNSPRTKI